MLCRGEIGVRDEEEDRKCLVLKSTNICLLRKNWVQCLLWMLNELWLYWRVLVWDIIEKGEVCDGCIAEYLY